MRAFYTTDDLPPVGGKAAAFCPAPPPVVTNPVASSWGLVETAGFLNNPQPSPHPAATPDISFDPHTIGSNNSPDLFAPVVYVTWPSRRPDCLPVRVRHHNDIPVPAGAYIYNANRAQRPPPRTGRRQTPWPRAFQRFPAIAPVNRG